MFLFAQGLILPYSDQWLLSQERDSLITRRKIELIDSDSQLLLAQTTVLFFILSSENANELQISNGAGLKDNRFLVTKTDDRGHFTLLSTGLSKDDSLLIRVQGYEERGISLGMMLAEPVLRVLMKPKSYATDMVIVESDRDQERFRAVQGIETMSAEQLDRHRGQTLGEMLGELPGVSILQTGPSISKPVLRGMHSQRIVLLNGGLRQEGQQWGAEHAPEIDPFGVGIVEVLKGARTVEFGPEAIGGVIRVTPKPLGETDHLDGELAFNAFSNNQQGALSLRVEGDGAGMITWLEGWKWRIQGSARYAGDSRTPDFVIENSGFRELNVSLLLEQASTTNSDYARWYYSRFTTELGIYRGAHIGNLTDLWRAIEGGSRFDSLASFSYRLFSPRQEISHDRLSYEQSQEKENGRLEMIGGIQFNHRREFDAASIAGITGQLPALNLMLLTLSWDMTLSQLPHQNWLSSLLGESTAKWGMSHLAQFNLRGPSRTRLIPDFFAYTGGVFMTQEKPLSEMLSLQWGARYDLRWQLASIVERGSRQRREDTRFYHAANLTAGVNYRFSESWSLAVNTSTAWRPPSINELFSDGVHHGTALYEKGNSELLVEQSATMDITLRHVGEHLYSEVALFGNAISNFIFTEPTGIVLTLRGAFPATEFSQSDVRLWGIEWTQRYEATQWLRLQSTLSLVRGVNLSRNEALINMPSDRLSLSAHVHLPEVGHFQEGYLEIGVTGVRRQDRVPRPLITDENLSQSSLSPEDFSRLMERLIEAPAGFFLWSLEFGGQWQWEAFPTMKFSLSIQNLTNNRYRDYLSRFRYFIDNPGRNIVLRLQIPFM